jgi:hypothetical protein
MTPKPANTAPLTDVELVEALEMLAPALRLARAEDLRAVANRAAGLAIEAADRIRDRANIPEAPGMIGKIRNVKIGDDGKLTADLEVYDAGRSFLERMKRAGHDPADGNGFRS